MMKNYFKSAALLLGAAAICVGAQAQGWRSLNNEYLLNPSFIPGWSGAITAANTGCGEAYEASFDLYQTVYGQPAGEYTLTANAFIRVDAAAATKAYVYINGVKAEVAPLTTEVGNLEEASNAFAAGQYTVTVKCTTAADNTPITVGVMADGTWAGQWVAFDNFKLVGPNGEVALVNGNFEEGLDLTAQAETADPTDENPDPEVIVFGADGKYIWNMKNSKKAYKKPDVNNNGGVFRKTNASPYDFAQYIVLPAGKYRWGVQSFIRYTSGTATTGGYFSCKGAHVWTEGESALDMHKNGTEDAALAPVLYITNGGDAEYKPASKTDAIDNEGATIYKEQPVMCMFDVALDVYPTNGPEAAFAEGDTWPNGLDMWDSGQEFQASDLFVNNPNLYRNYLEFELTEETALWIGYKKEENAPKEYWNPFRDFNLEVWDATLPEAGIAGVEADNNAPVEYYNIQGMRVANPTTGLYIVKQGNKVTKVIR